MRTDNRMTFCELHEGQRPAMFHALTLAIMITIAALSYMAGFLTHQEQAKARAVECGAAFNGADGGTMWTDNDIRFMVTGR